MTDHATSPSTQAAPGPEWPDPSCNVCDAPLESFLDLGEQPLADCFRAPDDDAPEFIYRLQVGQCPTCLMVQTLEPVDRVLMFNENYPFFSSLSARMTRHFSDTADTLIDNAGTDPFIVEIGSNDGVMLSRAAERGVRHLGFEPSASVAEQSLDRGVTVLQEFFERSTAAQVRSTHGPADVIFSANTICHIPDIRSVLDGVRTLLAPGGIFCFEDPYLGDIVDRTSFDQIYDEHCFLFSATSVRECARRCGLELVDVERLQVHGGEVRYTLARAGERSPAPAVRELLDEENARSLHATATLTAFADRVRGVRDGLHRTLQDFADRGVTVAGYGATAKSATVCNFVGIGPDLVARIYDSTPAKQGRLAPGSRIPVVPDTDFREDCPQVVLLFAWNHAEEIMAKESWYADSGRWLLYVPRVHTTGAPS